LFIKAVFGDFPTVTDHRNTIDAAPMLPFAAAELREEMRLTP
jgi:hypothetical protein